MTQSSQAKPHATATKGGSKRRNRRNRTEKPDDPLTWIHDATLTLLATVNANAKPSERIPPPIIHATAALAAVFIPAIAHLTHLYVIRFGQQPTPPPTTAETPPEQNDITTHAP